MSDDQIRDLFANADEWSPTDDADHGGADDGDADSATSSGISPPSSNLPPLQLGSDVEIANAVMQTLRQQHGEVIFAEGSFWYYAGSHWHSVQDHDLRRVVHQYDGAPVTGSRPVKLNKTRIDSIIHEMTALLSCPKFFEDAAVGINCATGFISFSPDGVPSLEEHDPQHHCRHVLKGNWYEGWASGTLEDVFHFMAMFNILI